LLLICHILWVWNSYNDHINVTNVETNREVISVHSFDEFIVTCADLALNKILHLMSRSISQYFEIGQFFASCRFSLIRETLVALLQILVAIKYSFIKWPNDVLNIGLIFLCIQCLLSKNAP
jgi:hypothetical protein